MASNKVRLKGRKTAKRDLEWQLHTAEDLHMKLIGIKLGLDEIPDTHLPQAPLCRATISLISDLMRKWQDRLRKDIEKQKAQAEKKDAPKKRAPRRKKKIT
tara:strand:+ start:86 stop:388 length:303 start_codon:yes stop_codon:yes gene_type:complete